MSFWMWAAPAALGIIAAVLAFVPIRLGIHAEHEGAVTTLRVSVKVLGPVGPSFTLPVPWLTLAADRASTAGKVGPGRPVPWQVLFGIARTFATLVRRIDRLEWRTRIGTGDAMATSWAVGSLWALKAGLFAFLARRYALSSPPSYSVVPDFNHRGLSTSACCIFRFTIGEIIVAMLSRSRRQA